MNQTTKRNEDIMGYSLSVPCHNVKSRDRLARFLLQHHQPFSSVLHDAPEWAQLARSSRWLSCMPKRDDPYDPTYYVLVGDDLSYGSSKCCVGFDFSSQGIYGVWMHAVLAWASLQVGRRARLNSLAIMGHSEQLVRYIRYDDQPIPVLTEQDVRAWEPANITDARLQWIVDELGFLPFETAKQANKRRGGGLIHHAYMKVEKKRERLVRTVAQREMARLGTLWKNG